MIGHNHNELMMLELIRKYIVDKNTSIVDICCGQSAVLSQYLYDDGYKNITAIDRVVDKEYLSIEYQNNIKFIKENYDRNTDISDYDWALAIHPCNLTELIINMFKAQNKGVILAPCEVPNNFCKRRIEWIDYLDNKYPEIKKINQLHYDGNTLYREVYVLQKHL